MVLAADPRAELAKALGVDFDATGLLGNVRSKRYGACSLLSAAVYVSRELA